MLHPAMKQNAARNEMMRRTYMPGSMLTGITLVPLSLKNRVIRDMDRNDFYSPGSDAHMERAGIPVVI
jgi:hypothetical protein